MENEKGFSLLEVIIAIALLSTIGVAFLGGLGTASKATITTDEHQTASNFAETVMEFVKNEGYADSYTPPPIPAEYAGYIAAINVESLQDTDIQKIVVTINHNGKVPMRLEGYKVRQ